MEIKLFRGEIKFFRRLLKMPTIVAVMDKPLLTLVGKLTYKHALLQRNFIVVRK
jgi:hypothetical protein